MPLFVEYTGEEREEERNDVCGVPEGRERPWESSGKEDTADDLIS